VFAYDSAITEWVPTIRAGVVSGAGRSRLPARLVSAPGPGRVVDVVADQPPHRNERWRWEAQEGEYMNIVEYVPDPDKYLR
jgi:hypothetical protein